MGNICTNNFEKQEPAQTVDSKNTVKISVTLGSHCLIDIITGNFRQQKADSLFVITQTTSIDHCDPLRQYVNQPQKTIEAITSQRKMFYKASVNKQCPYKKLFIAILPKYCTEQSQEYQQHLKNIIKELLSNSKDITLQLTNTIDNISQLPNQMILGVFFRELLEWRSSVKINLISNDKKMLNLYKFQLMKTQNCKMRFYDEGTKEHF